MTLNLEPIKARLDDLDYELVRTVEISGYAHKPNWVLTTKGDLVAEIHNDAEAILLANAPTDIAALVEEVEILRARTIQTGTSHLKCHHELLEKLRKAEKYETLINKIKAVCEQSNNSDGAYIKRLIEEMEGMG